MLLFCLSLAVMLSPAIPVLAGSEPAFFLDVPVLIRHGRSEYIPSNSTTDSFDLQIIPYGCAPWEFCNERPSIQIQANGKLGDFNIVKVIVKVGENSKSFDGATATFRPPVTSKMGELLLYWAVAENGVQSALFSVRYLSYRPFKDQDKFYFALIDQTWVSKAPVGSILWEMFPPVGADFPAVFERPLTADDLHTTNRYGWLAGHLILTGKVNASGCTDGGVSANKYATPCGEEKAAAKVLEWQNRYDQQIYNASVRYNIPARILKAMIAQETQFWPNKGNPYEIGLGSITENGVDMLLTWNNSYFLDVCMPAYGKRICSGGYFYMREDYRAGLRRAVWEKVSTPEEIDLLAAMLYASAAQVNQMVINTTYQVPGDVAGYEEMWKISVGNYHIGSGCVSVGLLETARQREAMTWDAVVSHMVGDCKNSAGYVTNVWGYAAETRVESSASTQPVGKP